MVLDVILCEDGVVIGFTEGFPNILSLVGFFPSLGYCLIIWEINIELDTYGDILISGLLLYLGI